MRTDYGQAYRELYQRHWWWRAREAAILDLLGREQPTPGWKHILDVGCGDGLFFDALSQFGDVEGVESAEDLVSASGPHRERIHIGPFDETFQPGRRFSLVLMLDVLEHLADPVAALRQAWALLEPGGMLLVTVPAFQLLWTQHDVLNHHYTRYSKNSFERVGRAAGIEIKRQSYFFCWLFPVKLAARLAERISGKAPEPPQVPALWLNSALFHVSRWEHKSLGRVAVPFGSSLMVMGRKPER